MSLLTSSHVEVAVKWFLWMIHVDIDVFGVVVDESGNWWRLLFVRGRAGNAERGSAVLRNRGDSPC